MDKTDNTIDTLASLTYEELQTMSTTNISDSLSNLTTINIDDILKNAGAIGASGSVTINSNGPYSAGAAGQYYYTSPNTSGPYVINTNNWGTVTTTPGLKVNADAEFEGDIKWKGRSLSKWLEDVEKRLAILVPDPEKLEHFEALKKAYQHYKTLEALCELPKENKE